MSMNVPKSKTVQLIQPIAAMMASAVQPAQQLFLPDLVSDRHRQNPRDQDVNALHRLAKTQFELMRRLYDARTIEQFTRPVGHPGIIRWDNKWNHL